MTTIDKIYVFEGAGHQWWAADKTGADYSRGPYSTQAQAEKAAQEMRAANDRGRAADARRRGR